MGSPAGNLLPVAAVPILEKAQFPASLALLAMSASLAVLLLVYQRHPLYEYWIAVIAGGVIAAIHLA